MGRDIRNNSAPTSDGGKGTAQRLIQGHLQLARDVDALFHSVPVIGALNKPLSSLAFGRINRVHVAAPITALLPRVDPNDAGRLLFIEVSYARAVLTLKPAEPNTLVDGQTSATLGGVGLSLFMHDSQNWFAVGRALGTPFSVRLFGARGDGVTDDSVAFTAAAAAAALFGASVYVPPGSYVVTSFALPSGVHIFGDGDNSRILSAHWTCTGTTGNEVAFTSPAAAGARTIAIPATGLSGAWLRIASVINCQSFDALGYQLGTHASDDSFLAEFVRVNVGSAGSATLYGALVFPYSNTAGGDSGSFTTSVARQVTFHENARISGLKFVGVAAGQTEIIRASFCRDLRIEDVTLDASGSSTNLVRMAYCLDSHLLKCRGYGLRTGVTGAQENCFVISSSQDCTASDCTAQNGYQGFDVTYQTNDPTYRGGPSVNCSLIECRSRDNLLDGQTSHYGTFATSFINPRVSGSPRGVRIRGRKDRVLGGELVCGDGAEVGLLIDSAAVIDSRVLGVTIQGYLRGIQFTHGENGLESLEALFGCGTCEIANNTVTDCGGQGILLDTAYSAADLVGPRVKNNEVHRCGASAIRVNAFNNGTVLEHNRISGVPSGFRGVQWESNVKRLHVGVHHIYEVDAGAAAVGGPSTASFMTNATVFPAGEVEAQLFIGEIFTDAATPFVNILRNEAAYLRPQVAGWQPFVRGLGSTAMTLDRSMFGAHLGASGFFMQFKSQNSGGTVERTHTPFMQGSGSPEGVFPAPQGFAYLRTNGGTGTTLYIKEIGTGATGWVAK